MIQFDPQNNKKNTTELRKNVKDFTELLVNF